MSAAAVLAALLVMSILHIGSFCYIDFALTGSFVIHCYLRRRPKEVLVAVLIGAGFATISALSSQLHTHYMGWWMGSPGAFLGLGSIVLFIVKTAWTTDDGRAPLVETTRWVLVIPLLCVCSAIALAIAAIFTPTTYDLFLNAFDMTLGGPGYAVGRYFTGHEIVTTLCAIAYNTLPLFTSVFLVLRSKHRETAKTHFAVACVLLGILGFAMYQVCPGAGPRDALGNAFPLAPVTVANDALVKIAVPVALVRNAMPSLHIGWMLLCFWNVRGLGWWARLISSVYLLLTIFATLGFGEHFLIDLVVAVPLCLCVQAICLRGYSGFSGIRLASVTAGGMLTLGWLVALRTGIAARYGSPAVSWLLVASTVVACCVMEACLRPRPVLEKARALPVNAECEIVAL